MRRNLLGLIGIFLAMPVSHAADGPTVHLYAAGSLRAPMTEIVSAYATACGTRVEPTYGASGALSERLSKGEPGDLLASADVGYPEALSRSGKSGPVVVFARNHLCAILRPGLSATASTVLDIMLDPALKVGTSSPNNDPGGAYAWAMFQKADARHPGARATLESKALKIGSEPGSLAVPAGTKNAVAWLLHERRVDVFLSYCTNGQTAALDSPGITSINLPPDLAVVADYGLTVLEGANKADASRFALFILSPTAQKLLADHGFDAPLLP
jgi:molybdate transport system substrate-binding protein